ncbi:MAG: single-stranded DNA-binding protein [Deltaproteobacteria bacterium]|nr:single-stranded DNA-binding protein [Deltaproteobacteria bacterium]
MGVNKVILLGNLGKDPELRYTTSQTAVCSFSLATGERRKDASGNWVDHTEWHNIVTFGKTAENCSNFLKKGRQAFIEGRIQTRKWQDKDGKDRYTTEIIATTVQFVGTREGKGAGPSLSDSIEEASTPPPMPNLKSADAVAAASSGEVSFDDDDIPF